MKNRIEKALDIAVDLGTFIFDRSDIQIGLGVSLLVNLILFTFLVIGDSESVLQEKLITQMEIVAVADAKYQGLWADNVLNLTARDIQLNRAKMLEKRVEELTARQYQYDESLNLRMSLLGELEMEAINAWVRNSGAGEHK